MFCYRAYVGLAYNLCFSFDNTGTPVETTLPQLCLQQPGYLKGRPAMISVLPVIVGVDFLYFAWPSVWCR